MRRHVTYILDADGQPQPFDHTAEWARWFESADRHVAMTILTGHATGEPVKVSTIFLAIDHNYLRDGPPILWETMVFGSVMDGEQERYTSAADALAGHAKVVRRVKMALAAR